MGRFPSRAKSAATAEAHESFKNRRKIPKGSALAMDPWRTGHSQGTFAGQVVLMNVRPAIFLRPPQRHFRNTQAISGGVALMAQPVVEFWGKVHP
jgi:hypothetical protein